MRNDGFNNDNDKHFYGHWSNPEYQKMCQDEEQARSEEAEEARVIFFCLDEDDKGRCLTQCAYCERI